MEIESILTETIKWDFEGSGVMTAVLENKTIKKLNLCEKGNEPDKCFTSTDIAHLSNVHKALGELLSHIS